MCEYCDGKLPLAYIDFDLGRKLQVTIDDKEYICVWLDHDLYHEEYVKINYCPICGVEL